MADAVNLTKSLQDLEEIADWFDSQEAVDVEEGLTKVREAAQLIKSSKARLAEIENEFQEIEKEISDDSGDEPVSPQVAHEELTHSGSFSVQDAGDEPVNLDDIPF